MKSNRNYPLLLASQFLGAFGDNAILAVIVGQLTLLQKSGRITEEILRSRSVMYTMLLFIPYVLLAPVAGFFNDRFPKTFGLTFGNTLKLLGTAVCAFSIWGGETWQIPGYLLVGVGACFYGPAKYGILPEVVPAERLVKANGMVELLTLLAIITGGVAGSLLVDRLPVTACYTIVFLLFTCALSFNVFMQRTPADPRVQLQTTLASFFHHLGDLVNGPRLGKMLVGTVLFWVCGAGLKTNFQAWGLQVLNLPNNTQVALLGLWLSVGIMTGSVLAGHWHPVGDLRRSRVYGFGLVAALALLWSVEPFAPWRQWVLTLGGVMIYPWVTALLIVTGFVAGLFLIPLNAALQSESDPEKLGKTIAVQNFCENIGMLAAGGLVAACVQLKVSAGGVFAALALIVLGAVLWLRIPPRTAQS